MVRGVRGRSMIVGAVITALAGVGCTISDQKAPPYQGPSELALAFTLQAIPDILARDGASQSQISVQARDTNGQPARNITFRIDILGAESVGDCGFLSARTLVTGTDGRASFTYTAPAYPCDATGLVTIEVVPYGTDAGNALARSVSIRLVAPGVVLPGGPTPVFTVNGEDPPQTELSPVADAILDASASKAAPGTGITSYAWDFGDGSSGTGRVVQHRFRPGTFVVTLTVTDTNGFSASAQRTVVVGSLAAPRADFVFSPANPGLNQNIVFNGSLSTAAPGLSIVRYDWNFGSGSPQSGVSVTKSYDVPGSYSVTLTVTDSIGQIGAISKTVAVAAATVTANFTFSPTAPHNAQQVNFNGSGSSSPSPITNYSWDFGDGTPVSSTGTNPIATHIYTVTTSTTFVVRLTVTDSAGRTATTTQNVPITFP